MNDASNLAMKSLMDLREIAKVLNIKNIIKYRKAELIQAILNAAVADPVSPAPAAAAPEQRKRGRPKRVSTPPPAKDSVAEKSASNDNPVRSGSEESQGAMRKYEHQGKRKRIHKQNAVLPAPVMRETKKEMPEPEKVETDRDESIPHIADTQSSVDEQVEVEISRAIGVSPDEYIPKNEEFHLVFSLCCPVFC